MNLLLAGLDSTAPTQNPVSKQCLSLVGEMELEGHSVSTIALPAVWDDCFQPLHDLLAQDWDAVVCLAEKDCEAIAVERVALNEADVTIKDRSGRRPRGKQISQMGDPGYWSGLPYRELSMKFTEAKLEATSSHSAGIGLSNYVFYRMMHALSESGRRPLAGLIHLPRRGLEASALERFIGVLVSCLDPNVASESSLQIKKGNLNIRGDLQSTSR